MDRLVEYVNHELKITISSAQLARVLEDEGLRWYQEETYFTERPDPQFLKKRAIFRLYQSPPAHAHVLCIDEMGPLSAKTYLAASWSPAGHAPKVEADYGRRVKV